MEKEILEILNKHYINIAGTKICLSSKSTDEIEEMAKELNDLFALRSVSRSLPTEEEKNIELMSLLNEMFEDEETMQKKEYKYGFDKCYRWIKNERI